MDRSVRMNREMVMATKAMLKCLWSYGYMGITMAMEMLMAIPESATMVKGMAENEE